MSIIFGKKKTKQTLFIVDVYHWQNHHVWHFSCRDMGWVFLDRHSDATHIPSSFKRQNLCPVQ